MKKSEQFFFAFLLVYVCIFLPILLYLEFNNIIYIVSAIIFIVLSSIGWSKTLEEFTRK